MQGELKGGKGREGEGWKGEMRSGVKRRGELRGGWDEVRKGGKVTASMRVAIV